MLVANTFYFNYQPVYSGDNIIFYEALLRLKNKNINIESYVQSIKDKQKFDLDIIKSVLLDTKHLNNKFMISINISIISLESSNFVNCLVDILKNKKIILEITEHDKTDCFETVKSNIDLIKNKTGVYFALDDFGKGYSNTDYLLCFPFDIIKIDRELVKNIVSSYTSYAILKTKVSKITNILNKIVIVEGIENKDQSNLVNLIGDCCIQGFFHSKPLDCNTAFSKQNSTVDFNKDLSLDFICILDKIIYDLTLNKEITTSHQYFNNLFLNQEKSLILDSAKNTIKKMKDPILMFFSSLIFNSDNFMIIRDDEGTAIYNNEKHINFMGIDFVGVNVNDICKKYPDYKYCIDLDRKLLKSDSNFLISNESVCTEHNIECYQTFRQKISILGKNFILCTVYNDNNALTMRKDTLTNIYNRDILLTPYVNKFNNLVFIDLNGFKFINDNYGHKVGDLCLKQTSDILIKNVRDNDLIIRYGGDEFIILTTIDDQNVIQRRMVEINELFTKLFLQKNIKLSFSFGVSTVFKNIEDSISEADYKMYLNKNKIKEET